MQIICPNCGSKSPIEAGSLVTQTRIVCARCAVEFAAELSDEQRAAPAAAPDERGIELFRIAEAAPVSTTQPTPVAEVAATEDMPAEEAAAVDPPYEELSAAASEVFPSFASPSLEVGAVEAAPAEQGGHEAAAKTAAFCPAAGGVQEVLSLPEEAFPLNEAASATAAAEADHLNILDDVFAAWTQSREPKPESDAADALSVGAAEDYVTSPLSPDYEAAHREPEQPEAELSRHATDEVSEVATAAAVEPDANAPMEAYEAADEEREPAHAAFADVPPQVAAAQSFDGYGLGVRLMRVSPLWLLVSGLSFISFVVLCNWFFVPSDMAQAGAARPGSLRNEATNRSLASVAAADAPATRPDSRNSVTAGATLPAEAEVVNASMKIEGPTPAPTAPPAAPAPTPEPAATPKAEQPKPAEAAPAQPAAAGRFTLQVGSYSAPAEAEARAAKLMSAGHSARVVEVEIPKRGKWYRVYVGGFASRGEAETHGKAMRERGLAESYIAAEAQ